MRTTARPPMALVGSLLTLCLIASATRPTCAGLAASEVVVVVNGSSMNSRTLANHYVSLRNIPSRNVIVLDRVPSSEVVSVDAFRDRILRPLLAELDRRQLSRHVQCISYSTDFPTAIDISKDLKPLGELPKYITRKASINALTFFYQATMAGNAGIYVSLDSNFYARRPTEAYFQNPGGTLIGDRWDEIQRMISDEEHAEAAVGLEGLLEVFPDQFPLAYQSAAQYALHGDTKNALRMLEQAIELGWNAGGYLTRDERFDSIREEDDFQVLELQLLSNVDQRQPSIGFDARRAYGPNGVAMQDGSKGLRFLLSTVLGVTRGGGTSLPEAITALERSAAADFTFPQGDILFCLTGDVRTKARQPGFEAAIEQLTKLGYPAEILDRKLPKNNESIFGLQMGTAKFDWSNASSSLLPGAIAENLTSHGGVMSSTGGQTKLTELIKAGAAGSSGTVVEPYALQAKFPDPFLYVHYARGGSLAEAFYLSVTGPYQLLIVGDPLCQPCSHAPRPEVRVVGSTLDAIIAERSRRARSAANGNLDEPANAGDGSLASPSVGSIPLERLESGESLQVAVDTSGPGYFDWMDQEAGRSRYTKAFAPTRMDLTLDGTTTLATAARSHMTFKLDEQPDGFHEIRLRFMADDPMQQKHDAVLPIWIGATDAVRLDLPDNQIADDSEDAGAPASNTDEDVESVAGQSPGRISPQVPSSDTDDDVESEATGDAHTRRFKVSLRDEKVRVTVAAQNEAQRVSIWHDEEQLSFSPGNTGEFLIPLDQLGMGPVRLQARAELESEQIVRSLPVTLEVTP